MKNLPDELNKIAGYFDRKPSPTEATLLDIADTFAEIYERLNKVDMPDVPAPIRNALKKMKTLTRTLRTMAIDTSGELGKYLTSKGE